MKKILILGLALVFSAPLMAQEFGALLGVHQTTADSNATGTSTDGKFNFKLGLAVAFELAEGMKFRTGALYNQRHFEAKTAGVKTDINFDYIDIPANFQYNLNEMVGLFGGLVVGLNVNDEVKVSGGVATVDPDADKLIPLLDLGVSMLFQDMIGFDVYYERGMGGFAENMENFSTFGANFVYWF